MGLWGSILGGFSSAWSWLNHASSKFSIQSVINILLWVWDEIVYQTTALFGALLSSITQGIVSVLIQIFQVTSGMGPLSGPVTIALLVGLFGVASIILDALKDTPVIGGFI